MKYTIKSLNDQGIGLSYYVLNGGIVEFPELALGRVRQPDNTSGTHKAVMSCSTGFEFDDEEKGLITFIEKDANGDVFYIEVDLSSTGHDYQHVLNKIKPMYDAAAQWHKKKNS